MKPSVSHDRAEESLTAKAKWFMQKPPAERLREALEEMALWQKIRKFEIPDDRSSFKTVRVLEPKQG